MDLTAIVAAGAVLVLVAACAVSVFIGRKSGAKAEVARQLAAGASAEQTAKRILGDAERGLDRVLVDLVERAVPAVAGQPSVGPQGPLGLNVRDVLDGDDDPHATERYLSPRAHPTFVPAPVTMDA